MKKIKLIIHKKIRRFLKRHISILIFLLTIFKFKRKNIIKNNTLLIIKLDAIGDYILFRNFLKIIKDSPKYKGYHITFLGNAVNKNIAETLDKYFVDEFIWINKKIIFKNPFYILKIINRINKKFSVVIQATYSREFIADILVKSTNAPTCIGFMGDNNNTDKKEKERTDGWYTDLINIDPKINFEFFRNKSFFSKILEENIAIEKPFINNEDLPTDNHILIPDNFVLLFPGAQKKYRRWPAKNFKEVGKYLANKYNRNIVICGSESDDGAAKIIKDGDSRIINLTGKTSLMELIYIISKAKLVISNDTSGAHISAALNIPAIILSQFNHYLRFVPYPPEISSNILCLLPNIFKELSQDELVEKFKNGSNEDISGISIEQVKEAVTKFITIN
jgi:ADP-heptose:LPS heptosyltransferase